MASVSFHNVVKKFGDVTAVRDLTLDVVDEEFLVLLGPSGCGKTTTMRMVAGLEEATQGEIYIADQQVNDVLPKYRDVAMVFQSYALYPHFSVEDNIGYPLKIRKIPAEERKERVLGSGAQGRTRRSPASSTQGIVRRSAPACCPGPGDRAHAARVPDGRAAVQP